MANTHACGPHQEIVVTPFQQFFFLFPKKDIIFHHYRYYRRLLAAGRHSRSNDRHKGRQTTENAKNFLRCRSVMTEKYHKLRRNYRKKWPTRMLVVHRVLQKPNTHRNYWIGAWKKPNQRAQSNFLIDRTVRKPNKTQRNRSFGEQHAPQRTARAPRHHGRTGSRHFPDR